MPVRKAKQTAAADPGPTTPEPTYHADDLTAGRRCWQPPPGRGGVLEAARRRDPRRRTSRPSAATYSAL